MTYPALPQEGFLDERGLFACQDPSLRAQILPLFLFEPANAEERPIGIGTAFRIDPWTRCATAFHLIEDLLQISPDGSEFGLRLDRRLVALEIFDTGYGKLPIPDGAWRPISGVFSRLKIDRPPLSEARIGNLTELAQLLISSSRSPQGRTPFLPMDLQHWNPTVGEEVLALGFADLDRDEREEGGSRSMTQYLYGSFGKITDIEHADPNRGRPWPFFRVDAHWPGGMSGGPVFNSKGHVVAVVSTGDGFSSSASFFSAWNLPRETFDSLDGSNPGCFHCHAVFNSAGALAYYARDRNEVWAYSKENRLTDIGAVSINPMTEEYMRV